jgi:hypothetical protein
VNHIWKNCVTNGQIIITSLITDKLDKLIFENCLNISLSASAPLVVGGLLANNRQQGSIISVRNNTPECFADDAAPNGAWAQSYIDTELTLTTDTAPAFVSYSLSSKPFALVFPNIDIVSGARLQASAVSTDAIYDYVSAKTFGGASRSLYIYSKGVFVDGEQTRVTGNLY